MSAADVPSTSCDENDAASTSSFISTKVKRRLCVADLFYDAGFVIFVSSNFLTSVGFGVPYAYTVVSTSWKRNLGTKMRNF